MKAKVIKTGEIVEVYHEPQHGQTTNIYKECVLLNGRMWTEDELNFCVKTSEAPEKIYIFENPILDFTKLSVKQSDTDIEYIRADAFIEKALAYLNDKFYFNNVFYGIVSTDFNAMEEMFEDFRIYMEGE